MRTLLLAIVLLGSCDHPARHVMGKWDRIIASGTWVSADAVDRMTVWYEGVVLRERDGGSYKGTWEEDEFNHVIFHFRGPPEVWTGSQPERCPDGSAPCLHLFREEGDDWYRGGYWP